MKPEKRWIEMRAETAGMVVLLLTCVAFPLQTGASPMVVAQAGSAGGTIGKQDKSVSGAEEGRKTRNSLHPPPRTSKEPAKNLSGTWTGSVTCNGQYAEPQPWPLTVNVVGANGHYSLTASVPNGAGAGTINGTSVTFTLGNVLNALRATGAVAGNRMSGTYVQAGSGPCSWFAARGPTGPSP